MDSLKGSSNNCVTSKSLSFIRTGNFSMSVCVFVEWKWVTDWEWGMGTTKSL